MRCSPGTKIGRKTATTTPPPYAVERVSPSVHLIRMDPPAAGWEQWFLIRSDAHHDNQHCDHETERRHLDQARKRNAGIIDCGDCFCAMQGKWDRRADKRQLRDELRGEAYIDDLVRYVADFYEPYAANFALLSPGNHETAMLKAHQTNLTDRLAERLKAKGSPVQVATYSHWVGFRFTIAGAARKTLWLACHHGYGGGGPVTRGVIQTARMSVYLPDADIVYSGHTHDQWIMPIARERISDMGRIAQDVQLHLKGPGYKDEYGCHEGWHTERGGPPKPLGAIWLRFYVAHGGGNWGERLKVQATMAD